jgi:flagellar basal body-associated protein FliL
MADGNEDTEAWASDDEQETGRLGGLLRLLMPVGIAVLAGAGGYLASRMGTPAPIRAEGAGADASQEGSASADAPSLADVEIAYFDLEPIVVNLNDPRQTRYLRVSLRFATSKDDHSAFVKIIEKRTPELRNWLIVYLADLSLEDIRGAMNLNRVRREIRDSINDRLWPEGRPLIGEVLLKEWVIQ